MLSFQKNRVMQIRKRLTEVFHPEKLIVLDESSHHINHVNEKKGHFSISITAEVFKNKDLVDCHRMVYDALHDLIKTDIHALSIRVKAS
ncbi:Stress-induced morphogen (activity unknown) [Coxiella endosymbiont of Amblyomma americanum]|nr:Stress-induced morphogen (activity unknown) [Coxiella endosymbiont of Amblyomma americanum]